ncbi:DUF2628 domain-containing protein [Mycolicibacterium septicum]|uniref:DUF2628 domain-containing protein n=1 Tax=Mycolicibacterium septicum TaxID=98668 RepID=UPI0023E20F13|nr:DUF2628 domain-containing protein [Mycolicibacterium septicum]MDF3338807.1 DUF2628 domain-containing protein [Mycolicibacterium septicum]
MTDNGVPPQYSHDPQNPYAAQNPYGAPNPYGAQNPYAAPNPFGAPAPGPAAFEVPEKWRSRFDFFSRYGQPASSPEATAAFKQLSFGQRMRLGANGPAFFFGPIYFAIKGPWRKGLSLFGISFVVSFIIAIIEFAFNFTFPPAAYGAAIGALYSSTANWAYFLHVTRGSTSWNPYEGVPLFRRKS